MKTNWKRPASAALAAVMTLSLVPLSGTVRAAEPVQPTAHYDMSHSGNQLLDEFKKAQKKVRPAVEAMLTQAEQAARGEGESYSYDDVFGSEGE